MKTSECVFRVAEIYSVNNITTSVMYVGLQVVSGGSTLLSGLQLLSRQLLLGDLLDLDLFFSPWYNLLLLRENHLNVTWTAHVRVDSTVSTECTTSEIVEIFKVIISM